MAQTETEPELDDDGLVIQRYTSKMLVVVPPEGFSDQIMRYVRSSLYNIHVGTDSVASDPETMVKGRLQDEFLVDSPLSEARMEDYAGLVIVGCEGKNPLAGDSKVLELARQAAAADKLITTWGNGLEVLIQAGLVKGKKVTGDLSLREAAEQAGARFTGREVQSCGRLVTSRDEGAGMRLGQAVVEAVRISDAEERWGTPDRSGDRKLLIGLGVLVALGVASGLALLTILG